MKKLPSAREVMDKRMDAAKAAMAKSNVRNETPKG